MCSVQFALTTQDFIDTSIISSSKKGIITPIKYCDANCSNCAETMAIFKECEKCGNSMPILIKSRNFEYTEEPVNILYDNNILSSIPCIILDDITAFCFKYGDMFYLLDKANILYLAEYYSAAWLMGYMCIARTAEGISNDSMPCWHINTSGYNIQGMLFIQDNSYVCKTDTDFYEIIPECGNYVMCHNTSAIQLYQPPQKYDIITIETKDIIDLSHYVTANCIKDICVTSPKTFTHIKSDVNMQIPDDDIRYAWVVMPDLSVSSMIKMKVYHKINDFLKVKDVLKYNDEIISYDEILTYAYSVIKSAIYDPIYVVTRYAVPYIKNYTQSLTDVRLCCIDIECKFKYESSQISAFTAIKFGVKNEFPIVYEFERSDSISISRTKQNYIDLIRDTVEESAAKICNKFTGEFAFRMIREVIKSANSANNIACIHVMHSALEEYRKTPGAIDIGIRSVSVYISKLKNTININTIYIYGEFETYKQHNYIYKYKKNLSKTIGILAYIIIDEIIKSSTAI